MPTVPANPNSCMPCPVQRTVKIYEYATLDDIVTNDSSKVFIDSLKKPLIAQVDTDVNGFFQATLVDGKYTVVIVENGKLYANSSDGNSGINPVRIEKGVVKINLQITYDAAF